MSGCEIRPLRADDVETVVELWARARRDAQPWLEERMRYSHADDLAFFRGHVMPENQVWVAADADGVVAFLALHDGHVDHLYVDPHAQGRGTGTALLDHAKRLAPRGLTLFTHQRNTRAREFYEHHGFRAVAFGTSPPPESEPDVKYAWQPDSPEHQRR